MKKDDLMKLVGRNVSVTFYDGQTLNGKLEYVDEFSAKYNWSKPGYFKIRNYSFRVSYVKTLIH